MNVEQGFQRLVIVLSVGVVLAGVGKDLSDNYGLMIWRYRVSLSDGSTRELLVGWWPSQMDRARATDIVALDRPRPADIFLKPRETQIAELSKQFPEFAKLSPEKQAFILEHLQRTGGKPPPTVVSVRTLWLQTLWSGTPWTQYATLAVAGLWGTFYAGRWIVRGFVN